MYICVVVCRVIIAPARYQEHRFLVMNNTDVDLLEVFRNNYPYTNLPVISVLRVGCSACGRIEFHQVGFDLSDKNWFYRFHEYIDSQHRSHIGVYLSRGLSCDHCGAAIPKTDILKNEI